MTQFLLNQQPVTLENVDPNLTVLNWLRNDRLRCGTKEGCASGDCGACTVVLGSVDAGKIRYQSANACLLLVGQLHGKQLLTVEDLADSGELHLVQRTLACGHASQCGFCTPGIVMSAFAMHKNGTAADSATVAHQLGGNLCRCTGYRPIVEAAMNILSDSSADKFDTQEAQTVAQLQALGEPTDARLLMPETLDALAESYALHPQARLLAGGTDLNLLVTQAHQRHSQLISLARVKELRGIERQGNRLVIGAMTTLDTLQHQLKEPLPVFSEMLNRFASQQVRNQGTLGGNIANASPIGDCAPALLALDARLRLRCGAQTRDVALTEFFTGYRKTVMQPGEFISHILIDDVTLSRNLQLWKVSKRREDDISSVFAAINLEVSDGIVSRARIAYGGMAATPARALHCEAAWVGRAVNRETLNAACTALGEDFSPLSDARASAEYRLQVAKNLLKRYFLHMTSEYLVEVTDYVR
ncbi:xanthine dehydrogenase small subunit [Scandinavium goeteborgense]|uniref:xanthine dehydrogenase small subunit n=1 Tax=Scandinavium goeteborgense TaxID=1851514 RepID=UPI000F683165|nr:xanthine dehydrogenase small subunit [Scandinavium goeteborgense]QKN81835.1 xanthine dehydrogenase small subunit [Scandinavium goeteborgense]